MKAIPLFWEGNLLFDQESPVNFKTVQPSELVCITKEMLLEGIAGDPQLAMDIMESLSTKFLSAMEQVRHYEFSQWPGGNLRSPFLFCGALRRAL